MSVASSPGHRWEKRISNLNKKPSEFIPKAAAYWEDGEPVPFRFLARAFYMIAGEFDSRKKTEIICNVFRTVLATTPKDLSAVVHLSAAKLSSNSEHLQVDMDLQTLVRALSGAHQITAQRIRELFTLMGDWGSVGWKAALISKSNNMTSERHPLTVAQVIQTLRAAAKESGYGSEDKKRNHVKELLIGSTEYESMYITLLTQLHLQLHLSEKMVLAALGHAAVYSGKKMHSSLPQCSSQPQVSLDKAARSVTKVYSVLGDYDKLIEALLDGGVETLVKKFQDEILKHRSAEKPERLPDNANATKRVCVRRSLDLVPVAAYNGYAERAGAYGAFLMACYNFEKKTYQIICKLVNGFGEGVLHARSASLRAKIIPEPKPSYENMVYANKPDVWFEPAEVWEVVGSGVVLRKVNTVTSDVASPNEVIQLRFPCFRTLLVDKAPEQATTPDQVSQMFP